MKESHIALITLITLLVLTAGLTHAINFEKTQPGYNAQFLKTTLQSLDKFTLALNFLLAGFLFIVAWKAARRTHQKPFMLVGIAFAFFCFKFLILLADRYFITGNFAIPAILNLFDLAILALLFAALLRK